MWYENMFDVKWFSIIINLIYTNCKTNYIVKISPIARDLVEASLLVGKDILFIEINFNILWM